MRLKRRRFGQLIFISTAAITFVDFVKNFFQNKAGSTLASKPDSANKQLASTPDCFDTFDVCPTGVHLNPPQCVHRVDCLTREVLK